MADSNNETTSAQNTSKDTSCASDLKEIILRECAKSERQKDPLKTFGRATLFQGSLLMGAAFLSKRVSFLPKNPVMLVGVTTFIAGMNMISFSNSRQRAKTEMRHHFEENIDKYEAMFKKHEEEFKRMGADWEKRSKEWEKFCKERSKQQKDKPISETEDLIDHAQSTES